ncbi:MAG: glucose-6-phosphate isomerase [Halioglobus sp.]|jgi:glucose-6-phosphate isomerase
MAETRLLYELPGFDTLKSLSAALKSSSIEQMLVSDVNRVMNFSACAAGLSLDYSKQLLSSEALQTLIQLGKDARLTDSAAALLAGETLNTTENRPALHSLLRTSCAPTSAEGSLGEKFCEVQSCRERMKYWANRLNQGEHCGYTNETITDIVNIGIGGSDLGPRLTTKALTSYHGSLNCHYVANVDPADLSDALASLNPATTLFIVCSKTFTTQETLSNALIARQWMLQAGASTGDLNRHFLAATSNLSAATKFGIPAENCLPLWDWVGGRYSVWSAVGLSCAIAMGWNNFEQFLAGASAMDDHFASAPVESNLPMLMSLLEVWNSNFLGAGNHVVLPYAQHLLKLPDFLQQLTMESNGKYVTESGLPLEYSSAPVLWGAAGTMGQHSFHQMLHQGTQLCPVDFILPLTSHTDRPEEHRMLVANCLAQSRALMLGRSLESAHKALLARGIDASEAWRLAPHLAMPGNRPSSTITMDRLTPANLGALLALYEHRTFCSGQLWGINSFDQWGVELGKEIGTEVLAELSGESHNPDMDASTAQLIARWRLLQ